jgi:SAM-dependent methyltransferase
MAQAQKDRDLAYLRLQADWTRPMRVHLYRKIALASRRRVLDVGCADGFVTAGIAERTRAEVAGIDIRAEYVAAARHNYPGISFETADAHDLPFGDGTFDAVIINFTLMWAKHPERVLAEVGRVLAPGGAFLASGEPDYGGRIDEPPELAALAGAWIASIRADGGDPFFGRRLKGLLEGAGFASVEVGVMPSIWEGAAGEELDAYLDSLRHYLGGGAGGEIDVEETVRLEREASRAGTRLAFLPIFWGIGEKE